MSLFCTLKSMGCTSWYQLYNSTNLITNTTATLTNTLTAYWLKNGGLAGKFDGTNYITGLEVLPNQNFTISNWVNQTTTASSGSSNTVYESTNSDYSSFINIYIDSSNYVNVSLKSSSTTIYLKSNNPIENYNWYNIIVRHTSSGITLTVNNMDSAAGSGLTLDIANQTNNSVGCKAINHNNIFTGYMKNLFIFNTDLSDNQIKKLYYLTYIN